MHGYVGTRFPAPGYLPPLHQQQSAMGNYSNQQHQSIIQGHRYSQQSPSVRSPHGQLLHQSPGAHHQSFRGSPSSMCSSPYAEQQYSSRRTPDHHYQPDMYQAAMNSFNPVSPQPYCPCCAPGAPLCPCKVRQYNLQLSVGVQTDSNPVMAGQMKKEDFFVKGSDANRLLKV